MDSVCAKHQQKRPNNYSERQRNLTIEPLSRVHRLTVMNFQNVKDKTWKCLKRDEEIVRPSAQ